MKPECNNVQVFSYINVHKPKHKIVMKLNIYTLGWYSGGYGGGLCVIAANSEEEAIEIAKINGWRFTSESINQIKNAYFEGEPQILDSEYYQE